MSLPPGTRLGPYEILAPIGAGGMGEVYRARDTPLDRTVAIKVLPADLAQDPPIETSGTHPLFDIGALGSAAQYRTQVAAFRDGQHFLMNLVVPSKAPTSITVLLNWRASQ